MRDKIAKLEHEQWAHWFKYMAGHMTAVNVYRWTIQAETPYEDLSETEKEADRKWADLVLTLIPNYEKYKAFWEQARMIDKQNFEEYEWKENS